MDEQEFRRVTPHVCITDGKHHIRRLLRESLNEFGFVVSECGEARDLSEALDARPPDLVFLGLAAGSAPASEMLNALAAKGFNGKILPFAPRDPTVVEEIQELAEELRLGLLPPLPVPFAKERLRESVSTILPVPSTDPPMDVMEAVREGCWSSGISPKSTSRPS